MKSINKLFGAVALAILAFGCQKEYKIVDSPEFTRCMEPIRLHSTVQYTKATLEWKVFPDAQQFILELYSAAIPEDGEPLESDLLERLYLDPSEVPYTYNGPEEKTCYWRVRSTNVAKKSSSWSATGRFTTSTDPATICSKPDNIEFVGIANKKFTVKWGTYPDTKFYVMEIYSKSIPSTGEPDEADLVKSLNIDVVKVPFDLTFDDFGTFYYRVKASNPESGRKDSKWVKGSIEVKPFIWPSDPTAFTESFAASKPNTCPELANVASGTAITKDIIYENVIYANGCMYYGDRFSFRATPALNADKTLPTTRHIRFKVNVPGTVTFVPRIQNTVGKKLRVSLVTNKPSEGEVITTLYDEVFELDQRPTSPASGQSSVVIISIPITEEMLFGITEPATVYLWSKDGAAYQIYNITWTKAE